MLLFNLCVIPNFSTQYNCDNSSKHSKFVNEVGVQQMADSYVFRRLAQLTIYQWTKLSESGFKGETFGAIYIS